MKGKTMEQFLRGLLCNLEQRCQALRQRMAAIDAVDLRTQVLSTYQDIERIRREVVQLLSDPSLGQPTVLANQFQVYNQLSQQVMQLECYPLTFLERYGEADRQITRLCARFTQEVHWPLPAPLVVAFSNDYYWTIAELNLICIPAAENTTLLGLPDLPHEFGHILLEQHRQELIGNFLQELASHIKTELRRATNLQRSPADRLLYAQLFAQWRDQWLLEFVSDMVATYLVGPSFGWQHMRLCASLSVQSVYYPALGETAVHPADDARLFGILAVLEEMNAGAAATRINGLWTEYLAVAGEMQPPEYEVCYPSTLIRSLARQVVAGCQRLGIDGFNASAQAPNTISALLNEAWERFLVDAQAYIGWEAQQLQSLF